MGRKIPQLSPEGIWKWWGTAVNGAPCTQSCLKAQELPPSSPGPASLLSQPGGLPQHLQWGQLPPEFEVKGDAFSRNL